MIAIASDHGGFLAKEALKIFLDNNNYEYKDFGTCSTDSTDYPEYGKSVAEAVASGHCEKGIIICGTGIGISIAANKVPGIRAALCTNSLMAKLSREHNNANVLALGARILGQDLIEDIVKVWLETGFLGGRHETRINKICDIEKIYMKGEL
jgi:ribose 5-phosphate isomerase B